MSRAVAGRSSGSNKNKMIVIMMILAAVVVLGTSRVPIIIA